MGYSGYGLPDPYEDLRFNRLYLIPQLILSEIKGLNLWMFIGIHFNYGKVKYFVNNPKGKNQNFLCLFLFIIGKK